MRPRTLFAQGFTLLEVMVATAILGLTLTVILSAQGGLAASDKSANLMGTAVTLARCKMTELEDKLLRFGYPIIDDIQTDVVCCNEEETPGFRCDTKAQPVVLPNPPSSQVGSGDGGMSLSSASSANPLSAALPSGIGSAGATGLPGPLGSMLSTTGAGALDLDGGSLAQLNLGEGGIQNLGANLMTQMGGGGMGTQGLVNMVMGFVYPFIKPMMEMSIRKLTVVVHYKEGSIKREFQLVQYVTNPQNGGFENGFDGGTPAPGSSGASGGSSTSPPTGGGSTLGGAIPAPQRIGP
jgi:general secretion pathway protein I